MKKILLLFASIGLYASVFAQLDFGKLSNETLLERGKTFYQQGDYISATAYLYCYYQKNFDAIRQSNSTILQCLNFADKINRDRLTQYYQCKSDLRACLNPNRNGVAVAESGLGETGPELVIPTPPTYYTLVLSGSESLTYSIQANKASDMIELQIAGFGKAPSGYDANNAMGNGQITWLDRPVNADEPNVIIMPIQNTDFSVSNVSGQVVYGGELSILNNLKVPGQKSNFQVYNDGNGHFIARLPKIMKSKKPKR